MNPNPLDCEVLYNANSRTHLVYAVGRIKFHAIVLDGSVRAVALDLIKRRDLTPILYKGQPYPVARAVRLLKRAGKTLGITEEAKRVLAELS